MSTTGIPSIAVRISAATGTTPAAGAATTTSTSVGPLTATTTTSTAPTVTPVTPAPAENAEKNLFGMYVQAVKGNVRYQWVIFPPAIEALGVKELRGMAPKFAYIQRTQQHEGNRSKWYHMRQWDSSTPFEQTLQSHIEKGYTVSEPVVVPLELDDYLAVWNNRETPHKYLRAVDRVLQPLGLKIK